MALWLHGLKTAGTIQYTGICKVEFWLLLIIVYTIKVLQVHELLLI